MSIRGFSYRKVLERRDRLFQHALGQYVGSTLVGDVVTDVCEDLERELPSSISRDALYESIRPLAGLAITQSTAKELAWRLAGNIPRLNAGQSVHPWVQQVADEVVPFLVERVRGDKRGTKSGFVLTCRAVAGSPCPLSFPIFFSTRECAIASKNFGFSSPYGIHPYSTALHYMGLLFFGAVDAARSGANLHVSGISTNSSLLAENRPKIAVRTRARPCPRGFTHACAKCWLGCDECPAAVWPKTLVSRSCTECQADALFEPDDAGTVCLNCRVKPSKVSV